ncbi:alpha/beta hydrolase [Verrucosispora sp. WMMD573]|uniref:alpha/beta hydrolase n=1 Tax=Verrucosispora sp. WMMD573 TaxID=3015149 RepID=UPI00248B5992|nr:alpha/beta hydrolase [Verrucosispora sp. WMMD573]WBB57589.1 alpha/beta hydrolase [Verrucosispora sp. WMMD573]
MTAACRESSLLFHAADGSELPLLIFEPGAGTPPRAGIVLFHGGALREGSADGLAPHCRQLASHGIFAGSAGYRLLGPGGAASIDDCIADVRWAIDQFARVAAVRGLEASHLASGGSSAGAHLAIVAALTPPAATAAPRAGTAALVALNPAGSNLRSFEPAAQRRLERQVGIAPGRLIEYSLIELVRPGNPPMQIHHGTRDEVEPIDSVRQFRDAMVRSGNECVLIESVFEKGQALRLSRVQAR